MTINESVFLKKLIKILEDKENHKNLKDGNYLRFLFDGWDSLDALGKGKVCELCFIFSKKFGVKAHRESVTIIDKLHSHHNFESIRDALEKHAEQLSIKTDKKIIKRYLHAKLWNLSLKDYHISSIQDFTGMPVEKWSIDDLILCMKTNPAITGPLSMVLCEHDRNNDVIKKIVMSIDISLLNQEQAYSYIMMVNHLFFDTKQCSLEEVVEINARIGQYLDQTLDHELLNLYDGVPYDMIHKVPLENVYIQKYGLNGFMSEGASDWALGYINTTSFPLDLIKNSVIHNQKSQEEKRKWYSEFLKTLCKRPFCVSDHTIYEQGTPGFKILFTMIAILKIMEPFDENVIEVINHLKRVAQEWNLDIFPFLDTLLTEKENKILKSVNTTFQPFFKKFAREIHLYSQLVSQETINISNYFTYDIDYENQEIIERKEDIEDISGDYYDEDEHFSKLFEMYETVFNQLDVSQSEITIHI